MQQLIESHGDLSFWIQIRGRKSRRLDLLVLKQLAKSQGALTFCNSLISESQGALTFGI